MYAPGLYTGYAVKTLPSVREAIEEKRWDEVNREAERVAAVLEKAASQITAAARLLAPPRPAAVAPTLR